MLTKSAKKALRQSKRKHDHNLILKNNIRLNRRAIEKKVEANDKKELPALLSKLYKSIDKAAKQNILHPNKASRLKSRFAKFTK
ncbi:MAG: 30S ribosomal protein S20 [Candidatus Pacebacteria bacterium]|nr:30S ribosomal protein S20 [Candidatus Paceibacterota bacterium]